MKFLVNQHPVKIIKFPDGEFKLQVPFEAIKSENNLLVEIWTSGGIFALAQIVEVIYRIRPQSIINLQLNYLPYARADKEFSQGGSWGLKVVANLLNSFMAKKVILLDPHSAFASKLILNSEVISLADIIIQTEISHFIRKNNLSLVAPDLGAKAKLLELQTKLQAKSVPCELFCAAKVRSETTNEVSVILPDDNIAGKDLLICDDICDTGNSVIELAKKLKANGAKRLFLYVTHGIFSSGFTKLRPYFAHIFCYHTKLDNLEENENFFTILNANKDYNFTNQLV